jgi:hypothetical protein
LGFPAVVLIDFVITSAENCNLAARVFVSNSIRAVKSVREESMNWSARRIAQTSAVAALLFLAISSIGRAQDAAPSQPAGPVIEAKVAAKLSTKSAKVGDAIVAKTVKAYKLADGADIPKGSKLTGKVVTVQSKNAGNGNSMMTFRLEQIEVKGGAAIPIQGQVVAIGPSLMPGNSPGGSPVMARSTNPQSGTGAMAPSQGRGSLNGPVPNAGLPSAGVKDEYDIPLGSTMEGVALGRHTDADWTTALEGVKTDISLDSDVLIKVQLQ